MPKKAGGENMMDEEDWIIYRRLASEYIPILSTARYED
jgi:hypothetical protein